MGDVLRFPSSMRPGSVAATPLNREAFRAQLEEAAQIALDAADRIIAALDRLDDAPTLAAPDEADHSAMSAQGADVIPDTASMEPP